MILLVILLGSTIFGYSGTNQYDYKILYFNTFFHPDLLPNIKSDSLSVNLKGFMFTPYYGSIDRSAGSIHTLESPLQSGASIIRGNSKLTIKAQNTGEHPLEIVSFNFDYHRAWAMSPSELKVIVKHEEEILENTISKFLTYGSMLERVSDFKDVNLSFEEIIVLKPGEELIFQLTAHRFRDGALGYLDNVAIVGRDIDQ